MHVLSLDFGGSKIAAGIVETATGRITAKAQRATPATAGADASLEAMTDLAAGLLHAPRSHDVRWIGVSFGGPVDRDGRTVRRSLHVQGWDAFPLADRLEARFDLPAVVLNDGDAGGLGEARFGAGRRQRIVLYVTISTGIGSGIVLDDRIYSGEHGFAGEIGHVLVDTGGPRCTCGGRGCLEALASGPAIARQYASLRTPGNAHAIEVTTSEVVAAVRAGDPQAESTWMRATHALGVALASAASLLDPGVIVLGGGVALAGDLLLDPVSRAFRSRPCTRKVQLRLAELGTDSCLIGAAAQAANVFD